MELYFLRHGIAADADGSGDAARPLTSEGKERMRREAATLKAIGLDVDVVVTSPLVRARQTAEIVAEALDLRKRVVEDPRLGPGFDPERLAGILADHRDAGSVLLVGHEPTFSRTIAQLIGGDVALDVKKGSLARVDLPDPKRLRGTLVWLVPPKVLAHQW